MVSANDVRRNLKILGIAKKYLCQYEKCTCPKKRVAYLARAHGIMEDIGKDTKFESLEKMSSEQLLRMINRILKDVEN
jgi:hypothetical protein